MISCKAIASKSPQQRSDQTRKPVKSEQDSCSFDGNHGQSLALSGDPVDQTCGIQQRCCLIEQLLDVEGDFKACDRVSACKIAVAALRHSTASPGTVDCRSYFSVTLPPLST